jgi:hypothetical protein
VNSIAGIKSLVKKKTKRITEVSPTRLAAHQVRIIVENCDEVDENEHKSQ